MAVKAAPDAPAHINANPPKLKTSKNSAANHPKETHEDFVLLSLMGFLYLLLDFYKRYTATLVSYLDICDRGYRSEN